MGQTQAIGTSLGVKRKGGMDKLGRRACSHAANLYDSMTMNDMFCLYSVQETILFTVYEYMW